MIRIRTLAPVLATALALAACGSTSPPAATPASTTAAPPATGSGSTAAPNPAPTSGTTGTTAPPGPITTYRIEVVAQHPHSTDAWTEGLELYQGQLLESTGREGRSTLRLVDPATGQVTRQVPVADDLYAEGVTVVDGRALQLTWQNKTLLTTALPDLDPASVVRRGGAYQGEGWGLCYDGNQLVMSNGSDQLQFRDPDTFAVRRTVEVTAAGDPVDLLNELECVGGQVWANVWLTTEIVVIDPATGAVRGRADADALVPPEDRGSDDTVLNGIAFDAATGHFWLTGKLWPVIYEVKLVPASTSDS